MAEQALSDVKVLDLTWLISGPYCTKLLADYGADVLKVERPGEGDPARKMGPFLGDDPHPEKSGLFLHLNTNKKGITLNLKSEWGKRVIKELVKDVDILVESFRPGVMERLGLGYEALEQINPKLVMTSISSFGQTGPYRDYKASEIIIYGMGGPMNEQGLPDPKPPVKMAGTVIQYQGGSMAAVATMLAFYAARYQGIGQQVDVSLMETQLDTCDRRNTLLLAYPWTGEVAFRHDLRRTTSFPYGVYPCKDGYIDTVGGLGFFPRVANMIGRPDLIEKYQGIEAQMDPTGKAREEFEAAYWYPWVMERSKYEIFEAAQASGVLLGPTNTMEDVFNDPHFRERGMFVEVEHPVMGKVTIPGSPVKPEKMPWQIRRPAPLLGEHNEEVYSRLGYTKDDLVLLRERGVI